MPPLHQDLRRMERYKYGPCASTEVTSSRSIKTNNSDNSNSKNNSYNSSSNKSSALISSQQQKPKPYSEAISSNTTTSTTTSSPSKSTVGDALLGESSSLLYSTSPSNKKYVTGWKMLRWWIFGTTFPLSILTWFVTHSFLAVLVAVLAMPLIAILQGSLAILTYRLKYGDCPLPKAPSHGIVKCVGSGNHLLVVPTPEEADETPTTAHINNANNSDEHQRPLRLLVIGDSLAIGVGQSNSPTPIMPESIAKSLSKSLAGRPVLWTCHGAPGASAGWIVRELERCIQQGQFVQSTTTAGHHMSSVNFEMDEIDDSTTTATTQPSAIAGQQQYRQQVLPPEQRMDTDSSSSDETASNSSTYSAELDEETQTWQERLRQERIQFDPHTVGPFDIAVVLTGSNDLKSAFFPFLLSGEDAEFRRQAQQRGGGYGKELTRILQVLNRRMRMRLQTLRESVEAATEKMRERLGSVDGHVMRDSNLNGVNGLTPASNNNQNSQTIRRTPITRRNSSTRVSSTNFHEGGMIQEGLEESTRSNVTPLYPMVVLPGMPARALPIFQSAPLRWLAVPIVDIMDSHKRKLARHHDGEVLFVESPSVEDITDYACHMGDYWEQQCQDEILLNLKDIKRKHARRIEADMNQYYFEQKGQNDLNTLPLKKLHHSMFSVDGIHPNDEGYEFWGRYIAHSIVQEWKRKSMEPKNERLDVV